MSLCLLFHDNQNIVKNTGIIKHVILNLQNQTMIANHISIQIEFSLK